MSARHLNRTTSFDPFASDHYYQACLEKLIPALDDHSVIMDDDLLAATVILRLLEEFDGEQWISPHVMCQDFLLMVIAVPLAGSDLRGHSFGTKAFIQGPSSMTTTPSLRQAVYWSGLRQEIYNALSLQQPPDIDMSSLNSYFSPLRPDAGDCAWANQAIAHCADVLVFCFGQAHRSAIVHAELKAQNQQWNETRPDSFDPYFVGDEVEVGTTFPDIRFSCAWHGKQQPQCENQIPENRLIASGYSNWQSVQRSCADSPVCARPKSADGWTFAQASRSGSRCKLTKQTCFTRD
jgi:hypothetical protein